MSSLEVALVNFHKSASQPTEECSPGESGSCLWVSTSSDQYHVLSQSSSHSPYKAPIMRASGWFVGYTAWLLALTLELRVWAARNLEGQQDLVGEAFVEDKGSHTKYDFSKIPPAEPNTPLKFQLVCEKFFPPSQGSGGNSATMEQVRGLFGLMKITGRNFDELTGGSICTQHFVPYCQVVVSEHIRDIMSQDNAKTLMAKLIEIGCAPNIWGWNGVEMKDLDALRDLPMRSIRHWVNFPPDVLKALLLEQHINGDMPTPMLNSKFFVANLLKHEGFRSSQDLAWSVVDTNVIKIAARHEFGLASDMADYLLRLLDTRRTTLEQLVVLMRMEYFMNALLTATSEYDVRTKREILTKLNTARQDLFAKTKVPEVRSLLAHPAPASVSNFQTFIHSLSEDNKIQFHGGSSDESTGDSLDDFQSVDIIPFVVCPYRSFLDETRFVMDPSLPLSEDFVSRRDYFFRELSSSDSSSDKEQTSHLKNQQGSDSSDTSSSDHSEDQSNNKDESSRIKIIRKHHASEDSKSISTIPRLALDDLIRLTTVKVKLSELENHKAYKDAQESWLAEFVLLYPVELGNHQRIVQRALKKSVEALRAYLATEASNETNSHNPPRTIFSWCSMLLISGLDEQFGCVEKVSSIFDEYSPALRSNILQSLVADYNLLPAIFALCKTPDDLRTLSIIPYRVGEKTNPRMVYENSMVESLKNVDPRYLVDEHFFVNMVRDHAVADHGGVARWAGEFAAVVMMGKRNTATNQNTKLPAHAKGDTEPIKKPQELHLSSESDHVEDSSLVDRSDVQNDPSLTSEQPPQHQKSSQPEQAMGEDEDLHRLGFFRPGEEGYRLAWRLSRDVGRHIGGVIALLLREHSRMPYYVEESFFGLLMAPTRSNMWKYFNQVYKKDLQSLATIFGEKLNEQEYTEMILDYLSVRRPSYLTFTDFDGVANEIQVTGSANPRELLSKKRLAYHNTKRLVERFTKVIFKEFEGVILNIVDVLGLGMRIKALRFVQDQTLLAKLANFEDFDIDSFLPKIIWENQDFKETMIPSLIPGKMVTVSTSVEALLRSLTLAQSNRLIRLWAGSYKLDGLKLKLQNPEVLQLRTIHFLGFDKESKAKQIKQEEAKAISVSVDGDSDGKLMNSEKEHNIEDVIKSMDQLAITPSMQKSSREGRSKTDKATTAIRGLQLLKEDDEEDSKSEGNQTSSGDTNESSEEDIKDHQVHIDFGNDELLSSGSTLSQFEANNKKAKKADIAYSTLFSMDHNAYRSLVKKVALETIRLMKWDVSPTSEQANPFLTGTYSDGEAPASYSSTCGHTWNVPAGPTQASMVQSLAIFLCESLNSFFDGLDTPSAISQSVNPTVQNPQGVEEIMDHEMEETNIDPLGAGDPHDNQSSDEVS